MAIVANSAFSLINFRGPLMAAARAEGARVYALAPDYDDGSRAAVQRLGATPVNITLDRAGLKPFHDLRDAFYLYRTIRRLQPDLVFSYFIKPVIYGSIAARLAGVRQVFALVAGLGYIFTKDGEAESIKRHLLRLLGSALYRIAFLACRRVFVQNDDDARELVGRGLLPAAKVRQVSGTGVDLAVLVPVAPRTSPVTFLLMGRLLREKGIVEFVEAAAQVREQYPQTRFVMLGGADPNPGGLAEADVQAMAVGAGVEWQGQVDNVQPYLIDCSVYVLPSYREGKPRSTQEAMAVGRAVITTDAPGCRDTVDPGINGFLVPVRDSVALAQAMRRFIEQPDLITKMGLQSRRLAEERFDVHVINRVMLAEFGFPV